MASRRDRRHPDRPFSSSVPPSRRGCWPRLQRHADVKGSPSTTPTTSLAQRRRTERRRDGSVSSSDVDLGHENAAAVDSSEAAVRLAKPPVGADPRPPLFAGVMGLTRAIP